MKKLLFILPVILLLAGCTPKGEETQPIHTGEKEANPMTVMQEKVRAIVQDFAVKIGMTKEEATVGQFDYLNGTTKEGFQIVNLNYPREKYEEIEKKFIGWEMPIGPADGIAESMIWYQKDDMMCKLHTKLNATQKEIDNGEVQDKDYTVDITCFDENKSQSKNEDKNSHSEKKERIYFSLSAYGIEPVWNIDIIGNTLTYFGRDPEKGTDYHINTISTQEDKIIFEGEYVKAIFEKKSCISDGLGVKMPYTVQFILEGDMVFIGCGDEALDEFFVEDKEKQEDCEEAALSLIRQSVEVRTYIDDMEDYLLSNEEETKNNAREVGGVPTSLVDFNLVLEQEDNTALLFALKETHIEEDGTERETITKRFKIENLDFMPQEYMTEFDEYNELTPTASEAESQKLKSQYKKDCRIK